MIEVVYGIYFYAMTNVARGSVRVRRTVVGRIGLELGLGLALGLANI